MQNTRETKTGSRFSRARKVFYLVLLSIFPISAFIEKVSNELAEEEKKLK